MIQLSLPLQLKTVDDFTEDDFLLLAENKEAFNFLKIFFAQKDFTSASFLSLILKGEAASGKTHMLRIFTQKFPVEFLKKEEKETENPLN